MLRKNKYQNIPGWEIVGKGLQDIANKKKSTVNALAVSIASLRLNDLGFSICGEPENPTLALYDKLSAKYGNDAHYQYNALMKRVEKFCRFISEDTCRSCSPQNPATLSSLQSSQTPV